MFLGSSRYCFISVVSKDVMYFICCLVNILAGCRAPAPSSSLSVAAAAAAAEDTAGAAADDDDDDAPGGGAGSAGIDGGAGNSPLNPVIAADVVFGLVGGDAGKSVNAPLLLVSEVSIGSGVVLDILLGEPRSSIIRLVRSDVSFGSSKSG